MDIVQLLSSAFALLLVVVGVAVVWAVIWQLLKIRQAARTARKELDIENRIRLNMQAQGFNESEIRDAVQHLGSGHQSK